MQKPDLVLLGLAVLALVLTIAGFAASDQWSGERDVDYALGTTALAAQGPEDAGGAGARFNWTVPDNATGARLQVTVSFTGQAVQGGSATVTVRVTMPDGRSGNDTTAAMTIPSGSSTPASIVLDVGPQWAQPPADGRDVAGGEPAPLVWTRPLEVLVVASPPSDAPLATYDFTASVTGLVEWYHA